VPAHSLPRFGSVASFEARVSANDAALSASPMAPAIPAPAREAAHDGDPGQAFWQRATEIGALDEQQRLAAIERGWSSSWLAALRQHLHLKPAELEPLLALSEATMARRARDQVALDLVASERLDRLLQVISLAYGVFEQPGSTEAWLKAPHPLLHQASPLQHCRTAIGAAQVRRLLQALEQGAPV
jgi:putative toxin-antitoxin system antitoxin component (TIGR02293 family)